MRWFIYILKSENRRWYYTGSTNRLETRLSEHNNGKVRSTKAYRPFRIVFTKDFSTEAEARAYERLLKIKRVEKERVIREIEDHEQSCQIV